KALILTILAFVLFLVVGSILTFHGYIAWALARPEIAPLTSNPMKAVGLEYEEVQFASSSGDSLLEGWYIPSINSKQTVVFSHGYCGNREELSVPPYSLAKELHKKHYNGLLFVYSYV